MSDGIRQATHEDLPMVWQLIQELAEFERLSHTLTGSLEQLSSGLGKDFECFVCEDGAVIVGYMLCFRTYSTFRTQPGLWLEDLYVTPERRGQGFGKRMLRFLVKEAERRGYGRVEWSVLDWNEGAIRFYETMGARVLPDWRICRVSLRGVEDPEAMEGMDEIDASHLTT